MSASLTDFTNQKLKNSRLPHRSCVLLRLPKGDKKMYRKLLRVFYKIGYARAAASLTAMGKHDLAKDLHILAKREVL